MNVGLDAVQRSYLPAGTTREPAPVFQEVAEEARSAPLEPLARRLRRLVLGGRHTLGPEVHPATEREARILERSMLPTGAAVLRHLAAEAVAANRSTSGMRTRPDPERLAHAWLLAMAYCEAGTSTLRHRSW